MKVLERKEPSVVGICQNCGSKLEIEKGDIWWHKDMTGYSSPCVTCAVCGKNFDVEGWENINKIL